MKDSLRNFIINVLTRDIYHLNFTLELIEDTNNLFSDLTLEDLKELSDFLSFDNNLVPLVGIVEKTIKNVKYCLWKCISFHPNVDSQLILSILRTIAKSDSDSDKNFLDSILHFIIADPVRIITPQRSEFLARINYSSKVSAELLLEIIEDNDINNTMLETQAYDDFALEQYIVSGMHKQNPRILKALNSERLLKSESKEANLISKEIYPTLHFRNTNISNFLMAFLETTSDIPSKAFGAFNVLEGPIQHVAEFLYGDVGTLYLPSKSKSITYQPNRFKLVDVSWEKHAKNVLRSMKKVKKERPKI